ncbi:MAG TPA: hypothetical protein PLR86_04075, partial [Planctomycetota bacterium]|nr:hypothetical protein [Planctomycetota bacterium]
EIFSTYKQKKLHKIQNFLMPWGSLNFIQKFWIKFTQSTDQSVLPFQENQFFSYFSLHLKKPCIIYWENLHHADIDTLDALFFLIHACRDKPVLFIFTICSMWVDRPVLPKEFQGNDVPIMVKLQAMKALQSGGSDRSKLSVVKKIQQLAKNITWDVADEEVLFSILQKVFHKSVSHDVIYQIIDLSHRDPYQLSQVLLYFSDLLQPQGKRWKFRLEESELEIPRNMDEIYQSNMQQLTNETYYILEYMAVSLCPCTISSLAEMLEMDETRVEECMENSVQWGILQKIQNFYTFSTERHRELIDEGIHNQQYAKIHTIWSEYWSKKQAPHYLIYEHLKRSKNQELALNYIFQVAQDYEILDSPLEAFRIYKFAQENFSEIIDIYNEDIQYLTQIFQPIDKNKKENTTTKEADNIPKEKKNNVAEKKSKIKKDKNILQEKIKNILQLYKVAGLSSENPFPKYIQKAISQYITPQHFSILVQLVYYVHYVTTTRRKPYHFEDIQFFTNLLHQIIPSHFHKQKIQLYSLQQKIQQQQHIDFKILKIYRILQKKCKDYEEYYMATMHIFSHAKQMQDYFLASETLHKLLKNTQIQNPDKIYYFYEIEILYELAKLYEEWARTFFEEATKIQYLRSAVYAYIDITQILLRQTNAMNSARKVIQYAIELCQKFSMEDDLAQNLLKEVQNKQETYTQTNPNENTVTNIMILSDMTTLATKALLEDTLQTHSTSIVYEEAYKGISIAEYQKDQDITIFIVSYDTETWQEYKQQFKAQINSTIINNKTACSIQEYNDQTTIILQSDRYMYLLPLTVQITKNKTMQAYLPY